MTTVDVHDAEMHLSRLLARVEAGETVTISRAGVPVVALVPAERTPPRSFGPMSFTVPEDFDAPLPGRDRAAWGWCPAGG